MARIKERFTFTLNPESTEVVRKWLEANGQTISGWLTNLIDEYAKEIEGQPSAAGKGLENMTLKEFIDVAGYWYKKAQED